MGLKESGLRGSLRSTSSVLPAFFDVTITNTNSPVLEGDILTVDYNADNTGEAQDTQDIRLEIDSVEEDRDSDITLLGAQSTTGTLEWDTTNEDETTYTATVLSDDDTDSVTVEIEAAIPDTEVYLHDDWGDNQLTTDREGSGTTTHNGVEGVYRPEWAVELGDASVSNEEVTLDTDETVVGTDININLDETYRVWWEFEDGGGRTTLGIFAETNVTNTASFASFEKSYFILNSTADNLFRLIKKDEDGNTDAVISSDGDAISAGFAGAERDSNGNWELFVTTDALETPRDELFVSDYSVGTGSDSTFTNPSHIEFGQRDSTGSKVKEIKAF